MPAGTSTRLNRLALSGAIAYVYTSYSPGSRSLKVIVYGSPMQYMMSSIRSAWSPEATGSSASSSVNESPGFRQTKSAVTPVTAPLMSLSGGVV